MPGEPDFLCTYIIATILLQEFSLKISDDNKFRKRFTARERAQFLKERHGTKKEKEGCGRDRQSGGLMNSTRRPESGDSFIERKLRRGRSTRKE